MTETAVQSGAGNFEWPGVVGALYEAYISTNLLVSDNWTNANVIFSANKELMDWVDNNSTNSDIRFYRLKRIK